MATLAELALQVKKQKAIPMGLVGRKDGQIQEGLIVEREKY